MTVPYVKLGAVIPLSQEVYALSDLFDAHGADLYAVGGAVRDFVHWTIHKQGNFSPKDVDLATEISPETVVEILSSAEGKRLGIRVVPKGAAFGIISAFINGQEFEIATFREEWYDPENGDGRHPDQVKFSTPERDAARRDLTINALFYDIHAQEIRDYNVVLIDGRAVGQGLEDIKNLVVRPVGNARERFREDKLRVLRLVRFFSKYNGGNVLNTLDLETLQAVEEFKDLAGISAERIAQEFTTGLQKAINPEQYVKNYQHCDLIPATFPGLNVRFDIGQTRNLKAVLAWMLRDNDLETVRERLNALTYSNDVTDSVVFLLKLWKFDANKISQYLRYRDNHSLNADVKAFGELSGQQHELDNFLNYRSSVRSQDYLHLNGPEIGKAMAAAETKAYLKEIQK